MRCPHCKREIHGLGASGTATIEGMLGEGKKWTRWTGDLETHWTSFICPECEGEVAKDEAAAKARLNRKGTATVAVPIEVTRVRN